MLATVMLATAANSIDIHDSNRKGYYKIQIVGGELLPENYNEARTATDAAIYYWYQCGDCTLRIIQPEIEITGTRTAPPPINPLPIAPAAYYSTTLTASGQLQNPLPLTGAVLPRSRIFIEWSGTYSKAVFYCCKGEGEGHRPSVTDDTSPLLLVIDISTLVDGTGERELYTDLMLPDGTMKNGNVSIFTIAPVQPIDPETKNPYLTWIIPTERENGNALPVSELSGYVVMTRHNNGEIISYNVQGGDTTEYRLGVLVPGQWEFAVKAIDTRALESRPSDIITITIEDTPP